MFKLISQQIKNGVFPKEYRNKDIEIKYFKFNDNVKSHYLIQDII
jgi:hypothetical protein